MATLALREARGTYTPALLVLTIDASHYRNLQPTQPRPTASRSIMSRHRDFVIKDVRIFTGDFFIERGFIHVRNGCVFSIGQGDFHGNIHPSAQFSCPGDTLIPGLIDVHIHALGGNVRSIEQSLRFGVTTVCDMHNDLGHNERLRKVSLLADSPPSNCRPLAFFDPRVSSAFLCLRE